MPYITKDDIIADIPPVFLSQALDDNSDGSEDIGLWDKIVTAAEKSIHGKLSQRFATPFDPVPALVGDATRLFVLESLYRRRGYMDDSNPWVKSAEAMRSKLDKIAEGIEPLTPQIQRVNPSVDVITEQSPTTVTYGNHLA